ncbi:M23 family metallopeptidase [Ureibacillus sp. FSL K6-3587]|jgi:murein DD-endopeptidase MepM/ murein hydrolase activator NlpD|uniref:Peptidoglycan DD-metalloendopeptidase family protein n=1 Tax=Ureibacillus suwonensis TaxID=313007 RepID=A0ABW0RE42_9BACL
MNTKWKIGHHSSHNVSLLNQHKNGLLVKAFVTAVLLSTITFNLAFANEGDVGSIDKIYHVYLEDKYIGSVSDEKKVKKVIEAKEKEASEKYKGYEVDADALVTIVPEQVFSYKTNDSETLKMLDEQLEVQTDAYAFEVNGKAVLYLKNKEDYEETLKKLKLQYVPEEKLKVFEESKGSAQNQPLKENDKKIIDVLLSETVSGKEAKISPAKILTPDQAVQYIKTGSIEKQVYVVKKGDVLGKIAKEHGLTTKELLALNPGLTVDSLLQIGQEINVTVEKPLVNVQVVYETLNTETIDYEKVVQEDASMFKGEKEIIQKGSPGKKEVSYLVTEVNGQVVNKKVTNEKVLVEPKKHIEKVGTKVISSRGTGNFIWPTSGGYISSGMGSRWGSFHRGIDIARPSNYNIKASDNGVVTFAGWDGTYGNKIVVNHNNGYQTLYAHLSEIKVSVGQVVPQGAVIGIMGSTGNSTGVHLHFEVLKNGSLINPLTVLN